MHLTIGKCLLNYQRKIRDAAVRSGSFATVSKDFRGLSGWVEGATFLVVAFIIIIYDFRVFRIVILTSINTYITEVY